MRPSSDAYALLSPKVTWILSSGIGIACGTKTDGPNQYTIIESYTRGMLGEMLQRRKRTKQQMLAQPFTTLIYFRCIPLFNSDFGETLPAQRNNKVRINDIILKVDEVFTKGKKTKVCVQQHVMSFLLAGFACVLFHPGLHAICSKFVSIAN